MTSSASPFSREHLRSLTVLIGKEEAAHFDGVDLVTVDIKRHRPRSDGESSCKKLPINIVLSYVY